MRHRIEDLGRLAVMLGELMENELFQSHKWGKYSIETTLSPSGEKFDEIVNELRLQLENISWKIGKCWEIATGQDFLNEPEEGDK